MRRRHSSRRHRRKKSWTQKCKDYLRQFIAFLFSNVGIICLVVGYTVAGAVMFRWIESTDTNTYQTLRNISVIRNSVAEILWQKISTDTLDNKTVFEIWIMDELLKFQKAIIFEVDVNDYDGESLYTKRWSISAAALYCLTVITTIGYGNISPRTPEGKIATVVYAIFGMPLFLLYLSNIGDLLAKSFKWLYAKFCLCKMCRMKRRTLENNTLAGGGSWKSSLDTWQTSRYRGEVTEGEESDDEETGSRSGSGSSDSSSSATFEKHQDITVPISLCITIMVGYISGGALLFAGWEGWDFLDGSYFCFISLSTIGFGDIVPSSRITGKDNGIIEMNFIFCAIYLMLGMALIAMCFNLMQQEVVHKIRTCTDIVRRIARCRR